MTVNREQFLPVEFTLPNHGNELSKAEELIEKLKNKVEQHIKNSTIDDKQHDSLFNEIIRVLDYVGRLSMPAFAIEDQLEQMYTMKFKNAPQLAKRLWQDHYEDIHHPYTLLKNRCFRLLEDLDECYVKKFKKNPPNWKATN